MRHRARARRQAKEHFARSEAWELLGYDDRADDEWFVGDALQRLADGGPATPLEERRMAHPAFQVMMRGEMTHDAYYALLRSGKLD